MKTSLKDVPIKQCIDLALEKANAAVSYDTSNDLHNAVAAYTEAVELLVFILQHPSSSNDTEGLKSICNIYLERIDFLSYLKTSEDSSNKQNTQQNIEKSSIPLIETPPPALPTSPPSSSHSQQHHTSKINTMLMNIFAKKSVKKKKASSATSFSNHTSFFNFGHHQKDAHKSVDISPKSSKSSPMFPLEHSKWSRQARTKNHHLSSDSILAHQYHSRSLSYTSAPLYFQGPVNTQQNNSQETIQYQGNRSTAATEYETYPQKQFNVSGPCTIDKQYNTASIVQGSNYCYPAAETSIKKENGFSNSNSLLNTALPIPKKSSQRKKRVSPPPPGYNEPIRDSSLNATSAWRSTNRSPFSPKSANESHLDIASNSSPPPIFDKNVNRASASLSSPPNKRVSSLRLKTTFSLTNSPTIKSGGTISNPEDYNDGTTALLPCSSIPDSPIKTIKIDPSIILNYPEAQVTISNENIVNTFGSNMVEPTII
ncbi:hypothetical protein HMPREF1544_02948 [Mucor circinelloides 1006PhL]|uniref:MIT domain-containing protein n=1 Tax=Mucor circinelloides f. circinelloides (strain 1006PhL) TaxID=1220926 RepID=S2JNZ4_MUCC1|nr:hypothetical protein HMPREF1544_02948 [Mucor circinelloides 1006PhL]KAG1095932.1 hypothetical protein G6F42_018464 [Rhizopus arrhizus]